MTSRLVARGSRRRYLIAAALAIVFAFALQGQSGERRAVAAPAPFKTVNFTHYTDFTGALHIVGEVVNQTNKTMARVEVGAYLYNAKNKQIAKNFAYSCLEVLAPGARSTFDVGFQDPPSAAKRFELGVTGYITSARPSDQAFTISSLRRTQDSAGTFHIKGSVKNITQKKYGEVEICTGIYNAKGEVVRAGYTTPKPATLAAGKSGTFDWEVYEDDYPTGAGLKLRAVAHGVLRR